MRLLTREQSQDLDRFAMDKFGISGVDLMRSAGRKVAEAAQHQVADILDSQILILCGKGNNGGDGFAAAFTLHKQGFNIQVHSLVEQKLINGDSSHFFEKCMQTGCSISFGMELPDFSDPDIIIDGLLGTGFRNELKPEFLPWIDLINNSGAFVISIDIPSGLDCNSGLILPTAVRANKTITMGFVKVGLCLAHGKDHSGSIEPVDIGFPSIATMNQEGLSWNQIDKTDIPSLLQNPATNTYKHKQGKVLIVAGSEGMTGAAVLATYGALRSGAGLTVTCAPSSLNNVYEKYILEGMTLSCDDEERGYLTMNNFDQIVDKSEWADSIIIGPGLGTNSETIKLIKALVHSIKKPVILDADGLQCYSELSGDLEKLIVTPHLGEFSAMIQHPINEITSHFISIVTRFMSGFRGTAVIKHVPACICQGKQASLNSSGNPALATAGTGDVLSGMIGTFCGQGMDGYNACRLATYFHGKAADQLSQAIGKRGMIASDLPAEVAIVIGKYEQE